MENYWHQQTTEKPNYPDLIWSRPENKTLAGKLLVVGGNSFGFSAPVSAYVETQKAGAGVVQVLLPESTKKLVGHSFPDVTYATANHSGGFSQEALSELIELASWSDGTLISGELGNNSEIVILIEKFLTKMNTTTLVVNDAVDLSFHFSDLILERPNTIMVTDIAKLQKLQTKASELNPVKSNISLVNLVNNLHEFTINHKINLVIEHDGYYVVASGGMIGSAKKEKTDISKMQLAAHCIVWAMQNPSQMFEALNCAILTCQSQDI